ncbi:hypothetical protein HS041_28615 [Planomonospora sp. ID67723]|uniref:hypothetical protein n=1 Tax=Planomonospora sp. ID67723 TaxID=2738134 RepID=UPI0018C37D29|nr:hypothetical protein [Planomonospora sp. ID67723]MBG0831695.1 hypothetical protein [Planomonospora sp. ID67723]
MDAPRPWTLQDHCGRFRPPRPHRRARVCGRQERAKTELAGVDARITDLTTIRTALEQVVAARCDSLTPCTCTCTCTCADCPLPFADLAGGETR